MSLNSYRYRNGLPLATEVASIRPVYFVNIRYGINELLSLRTPMRSNLCPLLGPFGFSSDADRFFETAGEELICIVELSIDE